MGKGNRNSQQRLENQLAWEEKAFAKEQAKKNKKKGDRAVAIACIVVALLVVVVFAINIIAQSGIIVRSQNAAYIGDGSKYSVDGAMMTFYMNDYISNWYNQYYAYIMYGLINVDFSKDLSTQKIDANVAKNYLGKEELAGETWANYFRDTVEENVKMYLTYLKAADEMKVDVALTDKDKKAIDDTIKDLKSALRQSQMSISDQYGDGVTEKDIRACYELIYKADKFNDYLLEKFEAELKADNSPVKQYPEDNKGDFYSAKYLSYTINVYEKTEKTQAAYETAVKNAKTAAEKIKDAKTPLEFAQLVELYKKSPANFIKDNNGTGTNATDDVTEAVTETKTETTKANAETKTEKETTTDDLVEKYEETKYYETDDKLGEWMFGETVETNDVYVESEEGTEYVTEKKETSTATEKTTETATEKETLSGVEVETTKDGKLIYEKFSITVYMLVEPMSLDMTDTHKIAYIITDEKDAADKFLSEYAKLAQKDRETFNDLAGKHSEALSEEHSDHSHTFSYNKLDWAMEKYFADDYNDLNKWIDDDARKAGQYTEKIIEMKVGTDNKDTEEDERTTYYAVLQFDGDGDQKAWYLSAFNGALSDKMDKWLEDAKKQVTVDDKVISGLDIIG